MALDIRPCASADELRAAIAPIWHYFGVAPTDQAVDNLAVLMTPERTLAVRDADAVVAGCGAFPFDLTTPGGRVQAAGVTMVGVRPTHRRRGILTALMKRQLADTHQRGEPVAYLWPSEERIYGRFGYGMTGLAADIEISRDHSGFFSHEPPIGKVRLTPLAEAAPAIEAIFAQVAAIRPGMFQRSSEWFSRRILADLAWQRAGGGELTCVLLEIDGRAAAYALYRFDQKWDHNIPAGVVRVVECMAVSPNATRGIWRYLLDLDWCATIKAGFLPVDHPLVLLAAEPRRLKLSLRDGCWLRLVDLEAALASRAYGPGEIVIEVADALCPWNAGTWLIADGAAVKTHRAPDLRCDVSTVASAYLGGFSWRELVASCRAEAAGEDAIARADRVFERKAAPWVPEIF